MLTRKARCYLINNKNYDMTAAQHYGDLTILYPEQPRDVFSTSRRAFEIKRLLKDADSSDSLIVAGNMILVLIAFGILYEKFGFVNLLLFDITTGTYTPRVLPKHQLQGEA